MKNHFIYFLLSAITLIVTRCGNVNLPSMDIHETAESGSIAGMRQAIMLGESINILKNRHSPLYTAVYKENMEMVKFLIESGADVNAGQSNPLQLAVQKKAPRHD